MGCDVAVSTPARTFSQPFQDPLAFNIHVVVCGKCRQIWNKDIKAKITKRVGHDLDRALKIKKTKK